MDARVGAEAVPMSPNRRSSSSRWWIRQRWVVLGVGALALGAALGVVVTDLVLRGPSEGGAIPGVGPRPGVVETPQPAAPERVEIGDPAPPPPLALPEAASLNRLFTTVAARVTPAVVFIRAEVASSVPADGFHQGMQPPRETQAGSGVILSPQGYVVTNGHVVSGARRIRVLLNDRREYDAELVGVDQTTDLAVVRLIRGEVTGEEDDALPVAALGNSDALEVGEWVVAVGNPFRLTSTVTTGIVSALGRQVNIIEDNFRIEDFIQTDAAINSGNSGGALVNLRGEVVGIVTAIATESGVNEGYGFAVPVNLARRVATDLIERGEVERGYLGVEIRPVTAADARERGLARVEGVLVVNVAATGPAARAGLRPGDVLLRVDGEPVNAPNQFQGRVALRRPGETIELDVLRADETLRMRAALIGRNDASFRRWLAELGEPRTPAPDAVPPPTPDTPTDEPREVSGDWGIRLRDLTAEERRRYGVPGGAYVEAIQSGSAAEVDGLPAGTVITRVEEVRIATAADAQAALAERAAAGGPVLLRVRRPDGLTAFYDLASPSVE